MTNPYNTITKLLSLGTFLLSLAFTTTLQAAVNTWNNAAGDFYWGGPSANWTSPTTWLDGDDAIFGPTGIGTVYVPFPVQAHSLTFNSPGYEIYALGAGLTLSGTTPTITVNADASIAAALSGTDGLTVQAVNERTNLVLLGDSAAVMANNYSGGTYVKSGTLVLRAAGVSTAGGSYAVGNVEAVDSGATIQIGTLNDGVNNVRPADGQILRGNNLGRLNLTGGTFDNNGDDNGLNYPCPEGFGTIVNSSPFKRGVLKLQGGNTGMTYVFDGQIKDGGENVTTSQGVAYQQNIDMNGNGPYTLVLGGSNSFSGFIRLNSGGAGNKILLQPGGTLGYPAPINCVARQILMNSGTIDLNGTSQKVGYVYTGNDANSILTNSGYGTVSTLTVCYNCTNLTAFVASGFARGIRSALLDDPATGGTLALTKEGVAIQPIGNQAGDGSPLPNNYHGDTTVNNGILQVLSVGGISPNSAYRLNTTQGKLQLDYAGTALVKRLYIDGLELPPGTYGSATAPITGTGTLTVAPPNTWNNASADSLWNGTSANWSSPTTWVDGDSAIFGATGAGPLTNSAPVFAHHLTFNAVGYAIHGGANPLTLVDSGATITATAGTSNLLAVSILGTSGVTFRGTGTTVLAGDALLNDANHYTGGTYIKSGKVILQAVGATTSTAIGSAHAVDSIEALDAGATLVIPGLWNGVSGATSVRDQIAAAPGSRLNMTGGTLDLYNDPKSQRVPAPEGTGLIINTGPNIQAGLQALIGSTDKTFAGVITDGNGGALSTNNNFNGGPGYQIGIVQINSGLGGGSGGTLILSGSNTYSGSTRIDNGPGGVKLAGNGTIGFPTPNGLTGPLRVQANTFLDLNGHNQTIALMAGSTGKIFNSGAGTVSTLTIGYGNEQVFNRSSPTELRDNLGTGGRFALRKIITAPYVDGINAGNLATNCVQALTGLCTYSGDTTVEGGSLILGATQSVSPNSAYRLSTANYALLRLAYAGNANVRQLWINGVQQPNGVYGAGTAGIDPTSTGTITVTGYAPASLGVSQAGNALTFSWPGVYKLQTKTNDIQGPWFDYPGGSSSPVSVPVDQTKSAVYFRLATFP